MDWAEELKMSIRKTTARKGRRSKSKNLLKDTNDELVSSKMASMTASPNINKELSIDITLDLQQTTNSIMGITSTTATPQTSSLLHPEPKRPPIRRISGGWADPGGLKNFKSKKGSFEDDRFQLITPKSSTNSPPDENIPIIPDLDDIKDELMLNEIVEPPSVSVNRVVTLKELNSDLLSQNAFSAIEDVDLSVLMRCLQPQNTLDEADEVWEWEKLFTDITAEINSDKTKTSVVGANESLGPKIEIRPDEIPPLMHA